MDRFHGKVAIVTGASSGIGAATAERLVLEGMQVVGLGRRIKLIEDLAKKLSGKKGKLHAYKVDMSKESDILEAFKWTLDYLGPVYILINNAGLIVSGNLINGSTKDWKMCVETMILGLCIASKEAVNMMTAHKISGHIIHINSIFSRSTSLAITENMNIYPAIKHATLCLTESLRQDLNNMKSNIKISSISPGFTNTAIADGLPINVNIPCLQPEDIADSIVYVLSRPSHVQIHDIIIKPLGEKV